MMELLQSYWPYILAGTVIIVPLLTVITIHLFRVQRYKREISNFLIHHIPFPGGLKKGFFRYLDSFLEKKASQGDLSPLKATQRDQAWIQAVLDKPSSRNLNRLLNYLPQEGLFAVFYTALNKMKIRPRIQEILDQKGLIPLAASCQGQPFDGQKALVFLEPYLEEIRELSGHPLWNIRYFAVNILVHHQEEPSLRATWEALQDSHPLIRGIACQYYKGTEEDFITDLKSKVLNDGNQEVRRKAYKRLKSLDSHQALPDVKDLSPNQILHFVEFLDITNPEEADIALNLVLGEDWEVRLPAALFLQAHRRFRHMMEMASFEDRTNMERVEKILTCAAEVQILGFLDPLPSQEAPLYLGLKILEKWGSQEQCLAYSQKVFQMSQLNSQDTWHQAITTLETRNFSGAHQLLSRELHRRRQSPEQLAHLLTTLPENDSSEISNTLLAFLLEPDFPLPEELIEALLKVDKSLWLHKVLQILKEGRSQHEHSIRIRAFKLLGRSQAPYTLSFILEQLPNLPLEESVAMAEILSIFDEKTLTEKVEELLNQPDGQIRASLLGALPEKQKKHYQKEIKESLQNPDPEVRSAAIAALVQIGDTKSLVQAMSLLRDPIEMVRRQGALNIGQNATPKALEELMNLIKDENEILKVKEAAIAGICAHKDPKTMEPLIQLLDESEELAPLIQQEMALLRNPKHLAFLVKTFKDADPSLRNKIQEIFTAIGPAIEERMEELLELDIASLKPFLGEILDATGYVDHVIRRLKHRSSKVRKEAASILAMIGSKAAFRGIILAARDPNEDVRVMVTKALEKLASKEGKEILEDLMEDPDKGVRKYTKWALERVSVKTDS